MREHACVCVCVCVCVGVGIRTKKKGPCGVWVCVCVSGWLCGGQVRGLPSTLPLYLPFSEASPSLLCLSLCSPLLL